LSRIPSFDETEQHVIYDHQRPTELNLLKFMYDHKDECQTCKRLLEATPHMIPWERVFGSMEQ